MRVSETKKITIAGAGLAGTLLGVLLSRQGYEVEIFERNPDPRQAGDSAGRSINLALAERGRHALRCAGLLGQVDEYTIPMRGRMLHSSDGELILQPYGKDESEVIWSTHRAKLNRTMLDEADANDRVTVYFDHKLSGIDWDKRELRCTNATGEKEHVHQFDVLIGADGGGSAVRKAMQTQRDLGVSEELLEHGYRELTIPPAADGSYRMDPNALHIWPRGGFMMIALPNADCSFTVTLFMSNSGDPGFDKLQSWPQQQAFMQEQFPDAMPLLTGLEEDFRENPVGLLGTIRCRQWHIDGRAVLLGDAAHAVVPFHGQGMNAAFEDCVAFMECLEHTDRSWDELFEDFQGRRIDQANAIADMALENYLIMRDAVRDPAFLIRKALEHELERRHPNRFVARYSLVMFHRIPYAEAYRRGQIQAGILDTLLADVTTVDAVDYEKAARLIDAQLEAFTE